MNKWKSAALLTVFCVGVAGAADKSVNTEEIERFFYNKGYNDAKNKFYEKGYRDGLKFAERKLAEYRAKIKALEQGKYLLRDKKITYPEVYQTTDSKGNIRVVIGGCKIERPLSPADIVKLPVIDRRVCQNIGATGVDDVHYVEDPDDPRIGEPTVSNAVFLKERERPELPKKVSSDVKVVYRYFPNTQFYRQLLEKSNIVYSIYEDRLKAVFDSREEARKFCRLYRLKENKDCL